MGRKREAYEPGDRTHQSIFKMAYLPEGWKKKNLFSL
jgi:hypothetical protein